MKQIASIHVNICILRGISLTLRLAFVKLKCTVRILQGFTQGNETHVFQCKTKQEKETQT